MAIKAHLDSAAAGDSQRAAPRRDLQLSASGLGPDGEEANVTIHNISAAGLLIETALDLATGQQLAIDLPEAGIVTAAVVGGGAVVAWHFAKRRRPGDPSARADRSVNLDVGELVQVETWLADGTAQVKYRGAIWTAVLAADAPPEPGTHRVTELVGSRLLVEKV